MPVAPKLARGAGHTHPELLQAALPDAVNVVDDQKDNVVERLLDLRTLQRVPPMACDR